MNGKKRWSSEDLVAAFAALFDELVPVSQEDFDAELRAYGIDPAEAGERLEASATAALERLRGRVEDAP